MRYFLVDGKFYNPIPIGGSELDSLMKKHLKRLKDGVEKGEILFTAPKKDNSGIIYLVKDEEKEAVEQLIKLDPLSRQSIQQFRIIELNIRDVDENVQFWFK